MIYYEVSGGKVLSIDIKVTISVGARSIGSVGGLLNVVWCSRCPIFDQGRKARA